MLQLEILKFCFALSLENALELCSRKTDHDLQG